MPPSELRWRQVKAVAVPLEDRGIFRQIPEQGVDLTMRCDRDRAPADFLYRTSVDRCAESTCDQLGSYTNAQERHSVVDRGMNDPLFPAKNKDSSVRPARSWDRREQSTP